MAVILKDGTTVIRYATAGDYKAVLAINDNVYEGMDYLPAMYGIFLDDPNTKLYVMEVNSDVTAFFMGRVINGGNTVLRQASRIKETHSGRGHYQRFIQICLADIKYQFPQVKESIGISKLNLQELQNLTKLKSRGQIVKLFSAVSVQGTRNRLVEATFAIMDGSSNPKRIQQHELQALLKQYRQLHNEDFVTLTHQPYQLTDSNIEYIAATINPICFVSKVENGMAETKEANIYGMSLHTSVNCKVGLVIHLFYGGLTIDDFMEHLKCHLKYASTQLISDKEKMFHMLITFPINLPFGKVLPAFYKNGLLPGIYDERFAAVRRREFPGTAKF